MEGEKARKAWLYSRLEEVSHTPCTDRQSIGVCVWPHASPRVLWKCVVSENERKKNAVSKKKSRKRRTSTVHTHTVLSFICYSVGTCDCG